MELAAGPDASTSGGLIVAAIAAVFTIGDVANMLGEDEHWLHDLAGDPKTAVFASTASARRA